MVQDLHSQAERAILPPGIVVAKGDIERRGQPHSRIAARTANIARQADALHPGIALRHDEGRGIGGGIVEHDQWLLFRHGQQLIQRAREFADAVVGQKHYGNTLPGLVHAPSGGKLLAMAF